ncbi:MAG: 16S rRNA (guanine(966)-N(2))-methyltransferase RsmD [bacterium]|jgi:16S rRNA (guanine966-N2)-methyltransferase
MKVCGGEFRGRTILTPRGDRTRPTSGMVREALANVLMNDIEDARVIDLFAGCGSVGIELISRGAGFCYYVEVNRKVSAILTENLRTFNIMEKSKLITAPADKIVTNWQESSCDIIFLDPPFAKLDEYLNVLNALSTSQITSSDSIIIAQHDLRLLLPDEISKLKRTRTQKLGDNCLSYYSLV